MYNQSDNDYRNPMYLEEQAGELERRSALYIARVMGWMCVGLLTTVAAAMVCLYVPQVYYMIYYNPATLITIVIAQLATVLILSFTIGRMGTAMATVMFMLYSALTGLTLSSVAIAYDLQSIALAFGVTSTVFFAMSLYGFITKKDLTSLGRLLLFGLIGILLAGIVNLFLRNSMLDFGITCIGIVVFIGLIAYDTQKIKRIYQSATVGGYDEESREVRNLAIIGALTLYLDFINLFLRLLRVMGRRRN